MKAIRSREQWPHQAFWRKERSAAFHCGHLHVRLATCIHICIGRPWLMCQVSSCTARLAYSSSQLHACLCVIRVAHLEAGLFLHTPTSTALQ